MSVITQQISDTRKLSPATADVAERDARLPIIFVVTQSDANANGGVESISQVLQNVLRFKPLVITQRETAATQRWRHAGCEVHVWNMGAQDVHAPSALQANLRMFRLVRSAGCRIVHCNDISALWNTALGARLAGAKVIFNVRNIKPPTQRYGWRWQAARRVSQRQIVLSREMQRELGSRLNGAHGEPGAIDYIYSAVDPARFSPADAATRTELRARFGIAADCFAVGCIGSFDRRKGQLELINQGVPLLERASPQTGLFFIGDFAPEKNKYARRCLDSAKESGASEWISFVGFTSEVSDWYRALDLVVVASRNEGLARCMIESLACATPVVSFDVCSAREILMDHECGIVVPQGNYQELVAAIATLASQPELRRRLGSAGATMTRDLFNPARIVTSYEELYFSLINH